MPWSLQIKYYSKTKSMTRNSVQSSNLSSVGYDSENQILEIEFKKSGIYQYYKVPLNVYNGLMTASSHGEYFNAYIKNNFAYNKIG
jgi:hypothetical protein